MRIVRALKDNLVSEGYTVSDTDGEAVFDEIKSQVLFCLTYYSQENGFDVLQEIRSNPEWRLIPVVILSTSAKT